MTESIDAPSEVSERRDHKKKKHSSRHRKTVPPPPPGADLHDGGLDARVSGVPGSTPGCTAGAYATELDAEGAGAVSVASCFPEQAAAAREWLEANGSAMVLSLLLARWGPAPCAMDQLNRWLIRRVGRKCAEGTEEGRADMAALAVEAVRELRALPAVADAARLYRAVPWSAMGRSAPGLSEFCEESNIVWPTFTSLVRSEERARDMLRAEGGFLYIVEATQARDVTALAPVQSGADEIMLEPNSEFTITGNEQQGNVFVVGMRQNYPSTRPIMRDVEPRKHRHRHRQSRVGSVTSCPVGPTDGTTTGTTSSTSNTSTSTSGTSTTGTTSSDARAPAMPVIVKAPPSPAVPPALAASSRAAFGAGAGAGSPGASPVAGLFRSSARLGGAHASRRAPLHAQKPVRRVHTSCNKADLTMTMWSVGKGYLAVHSVGCRDASKVLHLHTPAWTTVVPAPAPPSPEAAHPEEADADVAVPHPAAHEAEAGASEAAHEHGRACSESSDDLLVGLTSDPGYGTMLFAPNAAPTFCVSGDSTAMTTVAGITPPVLLSRIRRGTWDKPCCC